MASIRRTLSPYNDRSYQNGGNSFSVQSPTHKGKIQFGVRRFLTGVFVQKNSRKGINSWKRKLSACLIFFSIGFLLGMAPFGKVEDIKGFEERFGGNVEAEAGVKDAVVVENLVEKFAVNKVQLESIEVENVEEKFDSVTRKQLIVVTPTYNRALQAYYLNRLGQTLRLVAPPLMWIVVEINSASLETADILRKSGVMYRHLVCSKNLTDVKDRGVRQRNTALEHIELHKLDGVVYFSDDDNIYSLELFENMRAISRFGTWPVAMLAQSKSKTILEGPVCNGSQVIGWHTNEKSKRLRRFHVDMSGFAFNSTILWDPKRWQRPTSDPVRQLDTVKEGFQETTFIEQVVEDEYQMESIPHSCSRIMNWHLHLEARKLVYPRSWLLEKNLDVVIPA